MWLLLPLTVIIFILFVAHMNDASEKSAGQRVMEQYLHEKYNADFVVSMPERKGSGFGIEGNLESVAYKKGDENLKFIVRTSSKSTNDRYYDAIWGREETARLKDIIAAIFGDHVTYSVHMMSTDLSRDDLGGKGSVPPFDEASKKYGQEITYYLLITSDAPIHDGNRREVNERIYALFKDMKTDTSLVFHYGYNLSPTDVYGVSLNQNDVNGLTSANDLNKYWFKTS